MTRKIIKCGWRIVLYGLFFITVCAFPIRAYAADAVTVFGTAVSMADGTGTGRSIATAESIYERSRQESVGNDWDRMPWRFLCFAGLFLVAVIIIKIRSVVKSGRQEPDDGSDGQEAFRFEFETIPEEESWQRQVREDIDAREQEGRNTRTLRFRRVNDTEYDLEVNELDYDMEVEYLDEGLEYIDIEQD
ncbi:MAG: hypothetical protein NC121_14635 [Blautia sp.]|nr:hypothetical protein [Blautia sp.]